MLFAQGTDSLGSVSPELGGGPLGPAIHWKVCCMSGTTSTSLYLDRHAMRLGIVGEESHRVFRRLVASSSDEDRWKARWIQLSSALAGSTVSRHANLEA